MKKRSSPLLIVLVVACILDIFISTAGAQNTIGLTEYDSSNTDGYVLFSPMTGRNTYLIDKCGKEVKRWTSAYTPGLSCYLLEDGSMIRSGTLSDSIFAAGGTAGILQHFNWDGSLRWSYRIADSTMCSHHDFKVLPNGNILVIVWQLRTQAEQIAAGRDSSSVRTVVWSESILELQPVGSNSANIVWQWNLWDHLVQNLDSTKANYGVVADHPELVNVNYMPGSLGPTDWIHLNSIDYNAELDQIVLSSFCFDEIWVIDHSTTTAQAAGHSGGNSGKGGDLLYRWGNPAAYGRGTASDKKFFHQHNAQWIPKDFPNGGKLVVFNNGFGRPGSSLYSTIDIIDPPINSDGSYTINGANPFGPANYFWEYSAPVKTDLYSQLISGVQVLQNGSILICAGLSGQFWEVDTSGKRVWKYINPLSKDTPRSQGQSPASNIAFRCVFYPPHFPGFTGRTLIPGQELELKPTRPALCEVRNITTLDNSGSYCAGSSITARFTADGIFAKNNTFYFELSDPSGSFSNSLIVDSLNSEYVIPFIVKLPINLSSSNKYRYRISSSNPVSTETDDGSNITIASLPKVEFDVPNPYNVCNFSSPVRVSVSGGKSYHWDDGVDSASRMITKPGRYYVTVSNELACEKRDSIDVNNVLFYDVKIIPTKPTTLCDGSSVGLKASGGRNYRWSTGDTSSLIVVSKQGWYKVASSDPAGCYGEDSIYVTVAPAPIISMTPDGTISLCPGDTITVVASPASNYYWSTGDTTQSIRISSAGSYYVSTMNDNCPGISTLLVVKKLDAPEKPIITRSGNMLTTSAAMPLQWYHEGKLIPGATGSIYTPNTNGVYTVSTTADDGCSSISDTFEFTLLGVRIAEASSPSIAISPNPFSDHISIDIESAFAADYVVECYTVLGEKVSTIFSGMVNVGGNQLNYVFPKSSSEGIYFIRVRSEGFTQTFKVIRE